MAGILFVGSEMAGHLLSDMTELPVTYTGTIQDIEKCRDLVIADNYKTVIFDLKQFRDDFHVVASEIKKMSMATQAQFVFFFIGGSKKTNIVVALVEEGFHCFVLNIPELSYSGTSEKVENYGALKKVLEEIAPFPVEYTDELQEGCDGRCSYTAEQIYIRNDMEEAKTVEVLIHEIGHAYMHDKTRFEEAKEHLKVISDRDSREIQAESLSYIVTHKLGLDTSGFSFPYIAAWSSNHTEQEVMNAMIYIRDEADAFYDLIEKKLELELNKAPHLNVKPALQTEETKPISNISDGDEVKMATGNLNYSTDKNTAHTENTELKEELNSELYNRMFEEQEHYRNWLLSLPPEEILFHAFSYSVREDILMTQEENNFSIEKCKALLESPTPLADMKRAYDKTETNYMDDIRSIMENHANDVIEENKKKSSDRETTVSSVRGVADFAELFANDRISGSEKEKD